ncbi:MAG: BlaI/MecI/CopY family transcriptional regulator [Eubacteriales bacterium]|nr:BlaI/MecI/CopY family transcriptional regulator [Eubacteriales bacterium]
MRPTQEKQTLTKPEWLMMEALWNHPPMFLSEIMESMQNTVDWKSSSFMTYLKRLTESGYIGYQLVSGNRRYFPLRAREDCVEEESSYILSKMTDDSARLLLATMVQKTNLSGEDKEQLQKLIAKLSGEGKRG